MRQINKPSHIKELILKYIKNNSKEYILTILIFIIGLFIGVMFINNCSEDKIKLIDEYILQFEEKFKQIEKIDKNSLFISSVKNNILLAIELWIAGTTVIGMPIVLGIILYRGFCLGVTISSISMTLGVGKGIVFSVCALGLQNLFFISAIITIGVSSIKLYKSIIADRRKENIKMQIFSHTIISLVMLAVLIFSSFIENEISVSLIKLFITKL